MPLPTIVSDPNVMLGKPVIAGTRITVELILEKMAAGESAEQLERSYPHLPEGSLKAVFAFAAGLVRNDRIIPLERRPA
jgi:uncharacterized protein (DUF433 family)